MATTTLPCIPATTASETWRRFQQALLVTLAAVVFGCVLYIFEKYVVAPPRRFLESPVEVMMRAFGTAHFLVGWLYLFTSPRLRNVAAAASLTAWTGAGVGLCVAFAWSGASRNPFVLMLFYSYFLIHEVRDQMTMFQRSTDAPPASPELNRLYSAVRIAVILAMMTLLVGVHLVHGYLFGKVENLALVPGAYLMGGWLVLAVATTLAIWRAARLGIARFGDLDRFETALAPLLAVYGTIFAVLTVGSLLGSVGLNFIILIHVSSWLVSVTHQLGREETGPVGLWAWLRRTQAGFLVLHLTLIAVILTLMAVRVYEWQRVGWISVALASSSFPYWSLMHISMAFWRGKS